MGIFKNITKKIKEFAPTIGSAIGMFYGGPLGAALGSGIGSLVGGRSAEEALKNAALTGAATYAAGGKDFGRGFKFSTQDSPIRGLFGSDTVTSIKSGGGESILSKLIPESTMGKIALAGGIGSLAALGAEEPETVGFKEPPFAKGTPRLGRGMVDGISFNLNDPEERAEYFRRVREKQGFTDFESDEDKEKKEDEDREAFVDPIRAYRGGFFPRPGMQQQMGDTGLNRFGAQISEKIVAPSQEKVREVPAFLDEIKSMAEERFGVELNGANQTGGGFNQMGARLPSFNQNIASLFEQMKNKVGQDNTTQDQEFRPARTGTMPAIREAPLMGFGGSPVASASASPFGGGQSRTLGGLGSMAGLLKMSEGGMAELDMPLPDLNDTRTDVEKMTTGMLKYRTLAGKQGLTEAQLREIQEEYAKRRAPRTPMMPMASVGDPSQLMSNFMVGGEVRGPGTGTSDSVPARLSDGEFVLTAKAIRGAGGNRS